MHGTINVKEDDEIKEGRGEGNVAGMDEIEAQAKA